MNEVHFDVTQTRLDPGSCGLTVSLRMRTPEQGPAAQIVSLRCQVRIDPTRRLYNDAEKGALHDLFGPVQEWSRTLRPFPLGVVAVAPGEAAPEPLIDADLPWPDDPTHAAARYVGGLEGGPIPLLILLSGTLRSAAPDGGERIGFIPHDCECRSSIVEASWRGLVGAPTEVAR